MKQKPFDLLALGEVLLRLSPQENDRITRGDIFKKHIGGAELNVVSGVSMLGLRTGMISKLPANPLGEYAKNTLRYCGVSDDYLVYDESEEARLGIYYYENGSYPRKPRVVYDRRETSFDTISIDDYDSSLYAATRCFHISGITLALGEPMRTAGMEMIQRFKDAGAMISFDVNFRGNLWSSVEARNCIEQILPFIDIFFCSEETAKLTFGKTGGLEEMMKSFTKEYPISIVASTQRVVHSPKQHTFGSVIYEAKTNTYYKEEPYRNIDVVDRIGSGDAYVSGVLYGLLSSENNLRQALEYGNACSALKCTISGDLPSYDLREVNRVIRNHKDTGAQTEMER